MANSLEKVLHRNARTNPSPAFLPQLPIDANRPTRPEESCSLHLSIQLDNNVRKIVSG